MSGEPAVLQVVILRDGLLVGTEVLVPGTYTVGSDRAADLHLDDHNVSPTHAVLFFQNGRAAVQDNHSKIGLYVNGKRVNACEVRSVDEILVGPFVLKTKVVSQKAAQRPAPKPELHRVLSNEVNPVASAPRRMSQADIVTRPGPVEASAARNGTLPSARRKGQAPKPPPAPVAIPERTEPEARGRDEETMQIPLDAFGIPEDALGKTVPSDPGLRAKLNEKFGITPKRPSLRAIPQSGKKGAARLYLELYWGAVRQQVRAFKASQAKPVLAAPSDDAQMPLWGFQIPADGFALAEADGKGFRLYVPPGATVERFDRGRFEPISARELQAEGQRRYVTLKSGTAVRLGQDELSLLAYAAPPPAREWANPLSGLPILMTVIFLLLLGGGIAGLKYLPEPEEKPDFSKHNLPPVAVRLLAPEPKKKEEVKKKLEALAEKAHKPKPKPKEAAPEPPKPLPKKIEKVVEKVAPQENKALKALAKLSAAGPATSDILAAVDKLGNGPGSRTAKDFKTSGLLGKAPLANAGLGTFGLGGGGKGGVGTLGAELLHGKGAMGIGALGAGGFGKGGHIGGTVARASARQVTAQGSIDREAVAKVVNDHLQEVRGCYERALLKTPGLAGKVVLEWTISTSGGVVTAKTKSSTLRSPQVEACILQDLKTWRFPKAKGGQVIVSYPFLFNSVGY